MIRNDLKIFVFDTQILYLIRNDTKTAENDTINNYLKLYHLSDKCYNIKKNCLIHG